VAELHLASLYEEIADRVPEAPALRDASSVRSFREFVDRSARLAAALTQAGIGRESKVAIMLANCNEWLETFLAALKVRAVPVNVNYRYRQQELVELLRDCDASALVFDTVFSEVVEQIGANLPNIRLWVRVATVRPPAPWERPNAPWADYETLIATSPPAPRIERSDDDILLTYTGGTTGKPKGVMTPIGRQVTASLYFAGRGLAIDAWPDEYSPDFAARLWTEGEAPVTCPVAPLMHSAGLGMGAIPTLLAGGCVVTLPPGPFSAYECIDTIARVGVTAAVITGDAMCRPIVTAIRESDPSSHHDNLRSLRTVLSAGVAWSAATKAELLDLLPWVTLQDACGSTEAGIGIRRSQVGDELTTNLFEPVADLKILTESGREIARPSEEVGLIATPSLSLGYYNDAQRSSKVYRVLDGKSYVVTGDFGSWAPDDMVRLLGRGSSVINTGGEKVFAEEIEDVLKAHWTVADALVVGAADPRFGEQVTAVVSPRAGVTVDVPSLLEDVRTELAGYKVPRVVAVVPAVPRLANGKPDLGNARLMVQQEIERAGFEDRTPSARHPD